ncbi:HID1 domain containing [Homo sapiens]|uniref:HID1 domain containing n=2 Tax=Homo sapiens TaxID=9606 RepID=E9PIM7_HUMAN|nr:HID1 domain containing [Homo sapiens]KAI4051453.1 HID1 domain containing [Homo sapiens]
MGSTDSKLNFRKAVIQLTTKTQPVEATDDAFWDQFWADTATSVQDVFALVPAAEIRAVREESPSNLATLCYKAVEKLVQGAESGCHSEKEKQIVLNCSRLLTRVLPYIFEDPDWRGFFCREKRMMSMPGPWPSPCSWPLLTCSSARTSRFRATGGALWTRQRTSTPWTAVNTSGRLVWASLTPPSLTTSTI